MFVLELEYLTGISFSSAPYDTSQPEWPPHPDRVFLALISSWGSKRDDAEADALKWLESCKPPEVLFPDACCKTRHSFVPTSGNSEKRIFPENKKLTPILNLRDAIVKKRRAFPASALLDNDKTVYLVWPDAKPSKNTVNSISNMASRVSYIGHSASLVRVAVVSNQDPESQNRYVRSDDGVYFLRCPYRGRFNELTKEFHYHSSKDRRFKWRPRPAPELKYQKYGGTITHNMMSDEWTTLSCHGSYIPTLEAFPIVAKKMKGTIMSHISGSIHEIISGHNPDGTILQKPHMAIVPMANIGWKYSDASLLGIAMILPRSSSSGTEERIQLKRAIAKFLTVRKQHSKSSIPDVGELEFDSSRVLYLKKYDDPRASMLPSRYTKSSSVWASATPIVLDQHPKKNKEPEDIIIQSCTNVGLPKPVSVTTSRYSNILGAPAAYLTSKSSKGWLPPKPKFLDNKFLCHAVISFGVKVSGPVLLGAGRYYGMGLCLPYRREEY